MKFQIIARSLQTSPVSFVFSVASAWQALSSHSPQQVGKPVTLATILPENLQLPPKSQEKRKTRQQAFAAEVAREILCEQSFPRRKENNTFSEIANPAFHIEHTRSAEQRSAGSRLDTSHYHCSRRAKKNV